MRIYVSAAIIQLFLIVTRSDVKAERKRIKCLYFGPLIGSMPPEDINATACTDLVYVPLENYTADEIYLVPNTSSSDGVAIVPALAQLKSENPELKLILHISYPHLMWEFLGSSQKSDLIQNGTKWLQANGFDGIDIPIPSVSDEIEEMVQFICEMRTEFNKYGLIVTTTFEEIDADDFPPPTTGEEDVITKMAKCCEYIALRRSVYNNSVTHRLVPLTLIKSNVDSYNKRGLPLEKILFSILTMGNIFNLTDSTDTVLGAKVEGPGDHNPDTGHLITYQQLMEKLNDSSVRWTFRRDEETKEPYAFTDTGLWASYEDKTSMEFKARYALDKGLGGIEIDNIDTNGIGGDAGFILTRAIQNIFAEGLRTVNTTCG